MDVTFVQYHILCSTGTSIMWSRVVSETCRTRVSCVFL